MSALEDILYPRREFSFDSTIRTETLHVHGICILDRSALLKVFGSRARFVKEIEFLDDQACNIVFKDERAMQEAVQSLTGTNLSPDGQWLTYPVPRSISQPLINAGAVVADTAMQVSLNMRIASESDTKRDSHHGGRDSLFYRQKKQRIVPKVEDTISLTDPSSAVPSSNPIGSRGVFDPLMYLRASSMSKGLKRKIGEDATASPSSLLEAAARKKAELLAQNPPRLPSVIYRECVALKLKYQVLPLKETFKSIKFDKKTCETQDPWDRYCSANQITPEELVHVLYFRKYGNLPDCTQRIVALVPHSQTEKTELTGEMIRGSCKDESSGDNCDFPSLVKLSAMSKELDLPVFVCPPFGHIQLSKNKISCVETVFDPRVLECACESRTGSCLCARVFDLGFVALRVRLSEMQRVAKEMTWRRGMWRVKEA